MITRAPDYSAFSVIPISRYNPQIEHVWKLRISKLRCELPPGELPCGLVLAPMANLKKYTSVRTRRKWWTINIFQLFRKRHAYSANLSKNTFLKVLFITVQLPPDSSSFSILLQVLFWTQAILTFHYINFSLSVLIYHFSRKEIFLLKKSIPLSKLL